MSVSYVSISWNRNKKRYDRVLAGFIVAFLVIIGGLNAVLYPAITFETMVIRSFGLLAFLLLHIILAIGPLARLNPRFNILLYNRRHLGVSMFVMAFVHGGFALMHLHSQGNTSTFISLFTSNTSYDSISQFPFEVLGFVALAILSLMAVTSHDYWLKNLGPKTWKALHMSVYIAYGLILLHVFVGKMQEESGEWVAYSFIAGFPVIVVLHLWAGFKQLGKDGKSQASDGFIKVGDPGFIPENEALIVNADGESIAVFRHTNGISAVSNYCRHQGGPLGEGRVIEGCITCPWHGYQYKPEDGCAPAPFQEKLETYNLEFREGDIWVSSMPNAPGTFVEPLKTADA